MHRSGTSMLTRMCNLLGADLGPDMLEPGPDNPTGYWEHRGAVDIDNRVMAAAGVAWDDPLPLPEHWINDAVIAPLLDELVAMLRRDFSDSALPALKDPRICRLLPLWQAAFQELDWQPRYLHMTRHPLEVERSLASRDGIIPEMSHLLWLRYVSEAETHTRDRPRAFLTYDGLLNQWRELLPQAFRQLDLPFPDPADAFPAIANFADSGHRHHQVSDDSLALKNGGSGLLQRFFDNLGLAAKDTETANDRFPALQAEIGGILSLVDPVLDHLRAHGTGLLRERERTISELFEQIVSLKEQLLTSHETAQQLNQKACRLDGRLNSVQQENAVLRRELNQAEHQRNQARHLVETREQALAEMQSSTSWHLTRPLRQAGDLIRRILGRSDHPG